MVLSANKRGRLSSVDGLGLDRFPVDQSGSPSFSDDFGAPRSGGRQHNGNDIFAARGTPIFAVRDGIARNAVTNLGGNSVFLTAQDGTRFFYSHLDAFGPNGQAPGKLFGVKSGDVLGFVGDTGNAKGTPPHLHFQMADANGPPVNPFPFLRDVAPTGTVSTPKRNGSSSPSSAAASFAGGGLGTLVLLYVLAQLFGGRRA
jgi:murein DD-endopeptidase MepM/ murein hydrolase activator NlpD